VPRAYSAEACPVVTCRAKMDFGIFTSAPRSSSPARSCNTPALEATKVDVGRSHAERGIRVEAKAGNAIHRLQKCPSARTYPVFFQGPGFSPEKINQRKSRLAPAACGLTILRAFMFSKNPRLVAAWGDDTKVRRLSGSRSCGDARTLSNLSRPQR
jgi:hypothetical protein